MMMADLPNMRTDMSRRLWIAGASSVPFVSLASAAAPPAKAESEEPFKLGVASYSLRKLSRADAIKALKTLDVEYINIKDFHAALTLSPADLAAVKKEFEDAGLKILGVGNVNFAKSDEAEMKRNFEYAKALGAPLIVMAPTKDKLPMIEKFVKEYNIKAAIHNHGPEDKNYPAPSDVLRDIKGMDPRMGLCVDIGHTARTNTDVVKAIRDAGPRMHDMHVKDLRDLMNKDSQVAVGDGAMPIPAIFRQLKKMGYAGGVMLEYEINAENPVPGMMKSFAYMRGVLAGMRA
jgi:sugar phosphate isomerase/epimerase